MSDSKRQKPDKNSKQERLARALRANLGRRKAQSRERKSDDQAGLRKKT